MTGFLAALVALPLQDLRRWVRLFRESDLLPLYPYLSHELLLRFNLPGACRVSAGNEFAVGTSGGLDLLSQQRSQLLQGASRFGVVD